MLFLYSDRATLSNVKITVKELIVRVTDNYYNRVEETFPDIRERNTFSLHILNVLRHGFYCTNIFICNNKEEKIRSNSD